MRKLSLTLIASLLSFVLAAAQAPPTAAPTYGELLERVKKGDPAVDFTAWRTACADDVSGACGPVDPEIKKAMLVAFRERKYGEAIVQADKVLASRFVEIEAHMVAAQAYEQTKNAEKAAFHKAIALGLVKSILSSGDGKSPETAFVVISVSEEYALLRVWGFMPSKQALLPGTPAYDRLEVIDPQTNSTVTLFFDIDRTMRPKKD